MNQSTQKLIQYLEEARASEVGLVRVLQSQIAMTPQGAYRRGLETHLRETRDHARRVEGVPIQRRRVQPQPLEREGVDRDLPPVTGEAVDHVPEDRLDVRPIRIRYEGRARHP